MMSPHSQDSLALTLLPATTDNCIEKDDAVQDAQSPQSPPLAPSVAVLMCTMNGQAFLSEQLDSIAAQTHRNWCLWVSDDGSTDHTQHILQAYKARFGAAQVQLLAGPRQGFASNFLSLVCRDEIHADYYAFSDQDDVWYADKLATALRWLLAQPQEVPALYCSRTEVVDSCLRHLGFSEAFARSPSFQNALVQNVGGGNTMVFNASARRLLADAGWQLGVVAHDWWAYLLVTACGGQVFYDDKPGLQYRQHDANLIGANHRLTAPFKSIARLMRGIFRQWVGHNIAALRRLDSRLTVSHRLTLDAFSAARELPFLRRLWGVYKTGVYRQTLRGNMGLAVAAIFKRL